MFVRTGLKVWCVGLVVMGATAAYGQPFTWEFGFEQDLTEGIDDGVRAIWQYPEYSGTTVRYDQEAVPAQEVDGIKVNQPYPSKPEEADTNGVWDSSQVVRLVDGFGPINFSGERSYEILFVWGNPADTNALPTGDDTGTNDFIRCTTSATEHLNRPSVQLDGTITFRLAAVAWSDEAFEFIVPDATILMVAGITETGADLPQGEPDTSGGDIEWVYPDGSIADGLVPAPTNGVLPSPTFPGGLRIHGLDHWPPKNHNQTGYEDDWQLITIDLGSPEAVRGFANNGTAPSTAGTNGLDATAVGDHVNRGAFESLGFTNDPDELEARTWAIYIDDVKFETNVADPAQPPSIQVPVYTTATQVIVNCDDATTEGGQEAELFINDVSAGTADIVGTQATFNFTSGDLVENDILTATQTVYGDVSDLSLPVRVTQPGVLLAEDFELYSTVEDFNLFWHNSINFPNPSDAYVHWTTGSAASCQHVAREYNLAGANAARLWQYIGHLNGSDAEPLVVTWKFQHHGPSDPLTGERTRFELARQASDTFSASADARLPGTTGIVLDNGPSSVPQPEIFDQYEILLRSGGDERTAGSNGIFEGNTNGFFNGNQGNVALTGIDRVSDTWHEMQIIVTDNFINYKIDGFDANPAGTNGIKTFSANGVPRPNTDYYNYLIIGQGYSNNGPQMLFDDISITVGGTAIPFGEANPVGSPDVVGPLYPNDTLVTVENIDTNNAIEVAVQVDGVEAATTNGPFSTNGMVTLTVPALGNNVVVTATQTFDVAFRTNTESCISYPVVAVIPQVTVESPLVPGQTTVEVSDVDDTRASVVKVYRLDDPETKTLLGTSDPNPPNPVTVNITEVTKLEDGWEIVATQTFGASEGSDSDSVTVGVPPPTLLGPLTPGHDTVTVNDVHPLATRVTVYVNATSNGHINTTGVTEVEVQLPSTLSSGETVTATQTIDGLEGPESNAVLVATGLCLVDFYADMSDSNGWTKYEWSPDDSADFGYDYGTGMGIPPAPGSDDTIGLKIDANTTDGALGGALVTPTGLTWSGKYVMSFDMWLNYHGPAPAGGSGSSEIGGGGIAWVPDAGTNGKLGYGKGAYTTMWGDGLSSRDYRLYKNSGEQFVASGQYNVVTNADTSPEFGPISPAIDISQFDPPQIGQTGSTYAGQPGFHWHHIVITVDETAGTASVQIDTLLLGTIDATIGSPVSLSGAISLFHFDRYGSLSGPYGFAVFDNVLIAIERPNTTGGDWNGDFTVNLSDFDAFIDCFNGPDADPDPITGGACQQACLDVFDFAPQDGDIDLEDFAKFQAVFVP
jgi:hypothetical protein